MAVKKRNDHNTGEVLVVDAALVKTIDELSRKVFNKTRNLCLKFGIETDEFRNMCWEYFLSDMMGPMTDLVFKDADHINRHIYNAFYRMLIDDTAKGLHYRTRKKQVDRLLKPHCVKGDTKLGKKFWVLEGVADSRSAPANFNMIEDILQDLEAPGLHFQKSGTPDQYGDIAYDAPSIKDDDMRCFLLEILKKAGGKVEKAVLMDALWNIYKYSSAMGERVEKEDGMEGMEDERSNDFLMFSRDHELEAMKIYQGMSQEMKQIHYHMLIKQMTLEKIAQTLSVSVGKVHSMKKDYRDYVTGYLRKNDLGMNNDFNMDLGKCISVYVEDEFKELEKERP